MSHINKEEDKMKILRQILALLLVLQLQVMATELLKKSDPEVIALCDKNGDKKIKGKEYVCYLDLKKKKAKKELEKEEKKLEKAKKELEKAEAEGKRLDDDINKLIDDNKKLEKIEELLGNK